jgi:hypothetical protein
MDPQLQPPDSSKSSPPPTSRLVHPLGKAGFLALCCATTWMVCVPLAHGQEDLYLSLNEVERASVDQVLGETGRQVDPAPEGKVFGELVVVNREVFLDDTPSLTWINLFHTTTRPWVVQDEVLWNPGDPGMPIGSGIPFATCARG